MNTVFYLLKLLLLYKTKKEKQWTINNYFPEGKSSIWKW